MMDETARREDERRAGLAEAKAAMLTPAVPPVVVRIARPAPKIGGKLHGIVEEVFRER